ncbi:hypothetical protein DXG01_000130 [Tephrocybe rancida]|nr:hypothetical protein DXG01_000130 [Tephrocybe rancida]
MSTSKCRDLILYVPKTTLYRHNTSPYKSPSKANSDGGAARLLRRSPELLPYVTNHESARKIAEALASSARHPLQSLHFLKVAHALGCKLKDNAYECVSFALSKKREWNGVISAVSLAQEHRGRASSRLLNWRTRAEVETEDYRALQSTLTDFKEASLDPTRRTFHLILTGHIRNRNLAKAKECLETMSEKGCPPDASTHAIIATHYRRLGADPDVEARALNALSDLEASTAVAVVNSLITLRLDVHDLPGALRLSTLFNRRDIEPIISVMTHEKGLGNTDLTGLQRELDIREPLAPNAATYSIFIDYQASRSNLHGALQIFRAMLTAQVEVTPGAVSSLVQALYAGEKGDFAVRVVANMCSAHAVALPLFDRLLSSQSFESLPWSPTGVTPTIRVFNSLLKGALSTHGLWGMETILKIMRYCSVQPNAKTLELLMNHIKSAELGHPRLLSRILKDLSSSDIQPNLRHIHIIFSTVLRRERNLIHGFGWNNVAARFSNSREARRSYPEHLISDDAAFFDPTAGIQLPTSLQHRRLARTAVESLKSRGVMSDSAMLALRIRHDGLIRSDLDAAREICDAMLDRGIRPTEYHFSALMESFTRAGDIEGAFDVMESASHAGVKPNVVMFTILIVGYAHKGNPDKAIQVFEDMVASGIAPDVPSIDAVVSAFFIIGAYEMARTILRTLWSYIQPFPAEFESMSLKRLAQSFRLLHKDRRYGDRELSKTDRDLLHAKLSKIKYLWNIGKRRWKSTPPHSVDKKSSRDNS